LKAVHKTVKWGGKVTLTGKVKAAAKQLAKKAEVELLFNPVGAGYYWIAKKVKTNAKGKFSLKVKVYATTKFKVEYVAKGKKVIAGSNTGIKSTTVTVKLSSGDAAQRALNDAAVKTCIGDAAKYAHGPGGAPSFRAAGGPVGFTASGAFAVSHLQCQGGGSSTSQVPAWKTPVATYWHQAGSTWQVAASGTPVCSTVDGQGWPAAIMPTCHDATANTDRAPH
ncbi:MAG: hypothetical protein LBM66_02310, partial [Bifidobacteriaceae bacterium]|nr:hypothetical protein [Bifidobacteriaceae bacterium]